MTWKLIKSHTILAHTYLTVIEDELELPSGELIRYLRFKDEGNSVVVLCRQPNGMILAEREFAYPLGNAMLQFPGGFVPYAENVLDGVRRELQEECGVRAACIHYLGYFHSNSRRSAQIAFVFIAEKLEFGPTLLESTEQGMEYVWLSEPDIDRLICDGEITNASLLAAWSIYKSRGACIRSEPS